MFNFLQVLYAFNEATFVAPEAFDELLLLFTTQRRDLFTLW